MLPCLQTPQHLYDINLKEHKVVDEDFVRMSEFVKKFDVSDFQDDQAFYEFTREEDLLYYQDVIHLPLDGDKVLCKHWCENESHDNENNAGVAFWCGFVL